MKSFNKTFFHGLSLHLKALGAFLLTAALSGAYGAVDSAEVVDADADFYLMVPDLPTLAKGFHESAFGDLWENQELREFWSSRFAGDEPSEGPGFFDEIGKEQWERFGHFFDGGVAIGITAPVMDWETDEAVTEEAEESYAIIADFSGSAEDLAEFLEPWSDQRPSNLLPGQEGFYFEEDFMGYTLRIEEVTSAEGEIVRRNGWTLVNGTAVLAKPIDYLRDAVARIVDPLEGGSLAGVDRFLNVRDRAGENDILLFLDLETIAEYVGKGMKVGLEQALGNGSNPLGITSDAVIKAIGFGVLETFHLSAKFGAERSVVRGGLVFEERKGLLSLLSYGDGPILYPSIAPDNSISTSVGRVRWMEAWLGVKEMLGEMSPNLLMMLEMVRNNFLQSTGVDFERSLIGSLGEETVIYTTPRKTALPGEEAPMQVDSVLAFNLKDPAGFVLALEGIKGMLGLSAFFENKEFEGATIHALKTPMPGDPDAFVSYAVSGDLFLFGTGADGLLEGAVARRNEGGSGFWNQPEVADILAELPAEAVGASYADLGFMVNNFIDTWIALQVMNDGEEGQSLDPESRPDEVVFPHFIFSGQMLEENGFFFESLILPKERLQP